MTNKTDFTQDELFTIWKAPYMAALAVMSAQPGGLAAEMIASIKAAIEARDAFPSELLQSLLSLEQTEADIFGEKISVEARNRGQVTAAEVLRMAISDIRTAIKILQQRADAAEIDEYKRMIEQRSVKIANAASEGGFLGIGGVRVSESEQQVLDEIRMALNRLH